MSNQYTFEDLFLKVPLYETFSIEANGELVKSFLRTESSFCFDSYCVSCNKESTFRIYSNEFLSKIKYETIGNNLGLLNRFEPNGIHFNCQRNPQHVYSYYFRIQDSKVTKVGQYPSVADIEIPGIQKYEKFLKKDYRDFSKAIGLYSHGVGAGSFVYLRRIFENLIEEIHQVHLQSDHWDDDLYQRSRMDDKIKLLQDKLPEVLVENRAVYGIMSKGIHELNEDECLALFPDVKLGIELILDEKLYEQEKQSKRKSFSKFVATATANLK
ncbi:hypothetical protein FH508_0008585 [Lysinibacillus sp. CD3-6]|uniref:short-chain dehydrogenase n=1 Tax=Lysinibacillus sp. CD3-6 TaxID=2892541 RepID=UPI0011200DA4|nr:short-chain dehydrogenase [Lysinibacillus sp. CD3-6]UED81936.1 hypothetical protein FH508_0008585 [Lysinibacillus sp. CD3-6]